MCILHAIYLHVEYKYQYICVSFYSKQVDKMKCTILLLILLSMFSYTVHAQDRIQGQILGEDGKPIPGAYIKLTCSSNDKETVSKSNGEFLIENIASTTTSEICKLQVNAFGFETYEKEISRQNMKELLEIRLKVPTVNLQEVEVLGRVPKNYKSEYSFSSTKIATKNIDLPQAISSVTKELITDRQAFQLADVVKVVSGVTPSSFYNQYAIRGISQNESGQIINGMRTRQFYFLQPLTSNIERVEVIKGPSSVTFSSVDPGGSINMVTKKPLKEKRSQVSLGAGSFNTIRGSVDLT